MKEWRNASCFNELDRAVLSAVDETLETNRIAPETFALLESGLGETTSVLEVVGAIGTWRMISSILQSLDIPLEEGVASWPPDGKASPNQAG